MEIVLVNPQIPQNTGSIARTCAATNTKLHVVDPAFEISDSRAKRAGLDYWPYVDLEIHKTWEDYAQSSKREAMWFFTKFADKDLFEARFNAPDILVFGSETKGLGESFLSSYDKERQLRISMPNPNVRSLNLSNAVNIGLYEAIRQVDFANK